MNNQVKFKNYSDADWKKLIEACMVSGKPTRAWLSENGIGRNPFYQKVKYFRAKKLLPDDDFRHLKTAKRPKISVETTKDPVKASRTMTAKINLTLEIHNQTEIDMMKELVLLFRKICSMSSTKPSS